MMQLLHFGFSLGTNVCGEIRRTDKPVVKSWRAAISITSLVVKAKN